MTTATMSSEKCYLAYGIGKKVNNVNTSLSSLSENSVSIYFKQVPAGEYGEGNLDIQIQNMDWLEKNVIEYQSQMDELSRKITFIPFQFGTVYTSKKSMTNFLKEYGGHFQDNLNYFTNKTEWGIKIFISTKVFRKWLINSNSENKKINGPLTGTEYFNKKRTEYDALEHEDETLTHILSHIEETVKNVAIDCKEIDFIDELKEKDKSIKPVFNLSLLVDNNSSTNLASLINKLKNDYQECGITPRLSGPWPPYNFVKLEN